MTQFNHLNILLLTINSFYIIIKKNKEVLTTIYERILDKHKKLENQIASIQSEINSLPAGKLQCQKNGKYHKWYHSDGHNRTHIPKSNKQLVQQLAIKEYLTNLSTDLSNEQYALEQYLHLHNSNINNVQQLLIKKPLYQEYVSSYLNSFTNDLSQWANEPYERNPNNPEHLTVKVKNNYYVRSKSEYIIYKLLQEKQIPFRYECALHLGEITIYPDFTIRHPISGKIYYWEHFGKMQDPKYAKNTFIKLETYARNNIFPTLNLITTYETNANVLNPDLVENIIKYYFL